jgi:hypothetical protein
MADDLRTDVLIPLAQPYTSIGYSSASPSADIISNGTVLATTGNDAIVDWVVVELRDATTPSLVLWSRYALVQRDGDVVDLDGTSALRFGAVPGSYHVAVHHRNHLGVMTATPLAFSAASPLIDFTQPGTATWGVDARVDMAGTMALWNGDITFNGQVKYTGEANDRDAILQAIGGTVPTATITGRYLPEDVNLDGEVKYTGARNDRDLILQTIGGTVPTNVRYEQVP